MDVNVVGKEVIAGVSKLGKMCLKNRNDLM